MTQKRICRRFVAIMLALIAAITIPTALKAETVYSTPSNSNFKAYMDYRTITDRSSRQYAIQQKSTTTPNGFRIYNGRYCIAIGTGYNAPAGTYVDVELSNGEILKCVVGDIKANVDTYADNKQCRHNNSVIEFIVDTHTLHQAIKSAGSAHALPEFAGDTLYLTRYTEEDASELGWEPVIVDPENTNSYLVTNKYTMDVGGNTLYMVEYAISTDFCVTSVDATTYDSLTVDYSVITL